jgi:hypothetical protein
MDPQVTKTSSGIDGTLERIWQPQRPQNSRVVPGEEK